MSRGYRRSMTQNNGITQTWKESVDALQIANDAAPDEAFAEAHNLVESRKAQISSDRADDDERRELLAAEAYLFKAKVKRRGYREATAEATGPARASAQTLRAGLTHSNGTDIENPT
jgi:hypothetical protein